MNLKILKYSSKMLKFFVQDMLDFQMIRAGKLIKDISSFNLRDAINEVVEMLEYIAISNEIQVKIEYRHTDLDQNPNYIIKTDS